MQDPLLAKEGQVRHRHGVSAAGVSSSLYVVLDPDFR
jgi:hypothetical protein